ncbi:MAG: hypothetical protein ACRDQF_20760 [Thermocrispum sp.]
MSAAALHQVLLIGFAATSVVVFGVLTLAVKVAYGRHNTADKPWWWGPGVPTRAAWLVMEAPASLGFAVIFFLGDRWSDPAPLLLFALWQAHYVQRGFIYPWLRRVRPGDTTPLLVPVLAFTTNLGVSFLNASILSWPQVGAFAADYDTGWLADPRLIVGVLLFGAGFYVNRMADSMLAALRRPGETGYRIPRGWLYERVSCPNYLGELVQWAGWAVATWSPAGAVFMLWSLANLVPRARANHAWYHDNFPDYPAHRRAVIPGVI